MVPWLTLRNGSAMSVPGVVILLLNTEVPEDHKQYLTRFVPASAVLSQPPRHQRLNLCTESVGSNSSLTLTTVSVIVSGIHGV